MYSLNFSNIKPPDDIANELTNVFEKIYLENQARVHGKCILLEIG
ncbi:hypothetical protein [Bacillus sp. UNC41MFS5]|nr:hypothetical protein [Bacillus sp. UNC41MFS5]